ncbi:CPBP family intramembrane glutamic endopeptidase [Thermoflavimicrobium daqui]|uniref:CPBP family intramembrane metalloprotease domain-containing protein n=1 Tax=Thermoflavimicrobium daqui TaxID=2137476 RepID=A0A364K867_9BACL|nr:CPBP family intramembrane glutamic endopeptidase [Thermoflavimicrobium daqui]RAL26412.1 CPBP family intramembrane metalloprotease domain-containing protein [Thermoflavimicrobium daqui]
MEKQHVLSRPLWSWIVGMTSFVVIIAAAFWLVWNGYVNIRYSTDHSGTIPIWNIWIPSLIGILLIRLIPLRLEGFNPLSGLNQRLIIIQSWVLIMSAVFFTMTLLLVKSRGVEFQLWFVGLKLFFLLVIPWMILRITQSHSAHRSISIPSHLWTRWHWIGPLMIFMVWFYLSYFSIIAFPHVPSKLSDPFTLIVTYLIGFCINSLLEEVFYRVWLQTRLELFLGTWPAILFTSIVWASWHIAIHSTGQFSVDIATVLVNQGITGLFLGYLWARYRNVWILIMIHGIMNAPPYLFFELFCLLF